MRPGPTHSSFPTSGNKKKHQKKLNGKFSNLRFNLMIKVSIIICYEKVKRFDSVGKTKRLEFHETEITLL